MNRRGKNYAGAWLVISCCCAYSTGRVVQHESTATGLDSGGLVRTSWDGDLHRWTAVDVLPLDGMQEVSGSSPLSSTRSTRSEHDLRPVRVPSEIVRPSSDRRSEHRPLALNRTDRFSMTAQDGTYVGCVEHAGDRDAVAGISKAIPGVVSAAELCGVRAGVMPVPPGPAQMSEAPKVPAGRIALRRTTLLGSNT